VIAATRKGESAAPVGVWTEDGKHVKGRVYKSGKTLKDILAEGTITLIFPKDVMEIAHTLKTGLPPKNADTTLDTKVLGGVNEEEATVFIAKIVKAGIGEKPSLINRAEPLTLEYLIETTKPNPDQKKLKEIKRIIEKVAPNSKYTQTVADRP